MTSTMNFSRQTVARFSQAMAMIRVRFAGETFDLRLRDLEVGSLSSDRQIRQAVATALLIPVDRLDNHSIDRHSNGNLTIRPADVFV